MKRRTFLKGLTLALPTLGAAKVSALPFATVQAGGIILIAKQLRVALGTSGRLGFYVDYSERSTTGDHTFYVCRTHGTVGQVSVNYSTYGDAHTQETGTLTWAAGDADIKSFTVSVPSKVAGDHRIYARLETPAGGAVLHHGVNTIAYGVIDDGSIAPDSQAVFFDADAATNGTGTQANPYNNIYDAISNVGSKRYIYGRGTTTPDGTNTNAIGGTFKCIAPPATRSSEETRVYIRNWPGFSCKVDGTGLTDCVGFYTKSGESYQTYRGIDFSNLNVTGVSGFNNGSAIFYHYGNSAMINMELCTADKIFGTTNNGGYLPWGVDGVKIWRCSVNNVQTTGISSAGNGSGMIYYSANHVSVQRCKFTNTQIGSYAKRSVPGGVLPVYRFNIMENCGKGILFGFGSASYETNFSIIQSNLIKDCVTYQGIHYAGGSAIGGKNWIFNNVFDRCGGGNNGAIYSQNSYELQIFNNIFVNCRKMWDVPIAAAQQSNPASSQVEKADYNHDFGTTLIRYEYLSIEYSTSALLNAASGLAANDSSGDPQFNNPGVYNYRLNTGSPCLGNGVGGVDQGIYLVGIEKLGPDDSIGTGKQPSPPTGFTIS